MWRDDDDEYHKDNPRLDISQRAAAAHAPPRVKRSLQGKPVDELVACLGPRHADVAFLDMSRGDRDCVWLRTASKRCGNVSDGGEHKNCTIYFMLTRRGVHQRCFCPCDTLDRRVAGLCKDYAGPVMPVPAHVVDAFLGPPPPPPLLAVSRPPRHLDVGALAASIRFAPPRRRSKRPR